MNGRVMMAALLLILTGICSLTDLRDARIYNAVLLPALVLGLVMRTLPVCGGSISALGSALVRMGMVLILFLPFRVLVPGGIGGGDVKLYAVIAALLEGRTLLSFLLISLLLAGIWGLLLRIQRPGVRRLRMGPALFCAAVLYTGGIYG